MKTYVQANGHMYDESGNLLFVGYSGGNKGRNPEGLNNPALQSERMIGPIPVGIYSIGAPYNDATTGPDTMSLEPDAGNQMFGRSEFKCHGDNPAMNHSASEGCIVFSPARIRLQIYSGDKRLRVVSHESDRNSVPDPEISTDDVEVT
ncbi:MAG: DUF2778 domain-containing protein [Patescibacteria group bacterium]|nr:DUF2778 domain-containing protein [Patescibacteria group bacterium]